MLLFFVYFSPLDTVLVAIKTLLPANNFDVHKQLQSNDKLEPDGFKQLTYLGFDILISIKFREGIAKQMILVLVIDLKDSVLYVDNAERSLACV